VHAPSRPLNDGGGGSVAAYRSHVIYFSFELLSGISVAVLVKF